MRYLFNLIILLFGFCASLRAQNQTVINGDQTSPINFSGSGCNYTWVNSNPAIGLAATGSGSSIPSFTAINNGTTPITATITATPVQQVYAYVTNGNDANVSVIDVAQGKIIKTIPVKPGPWDVKAGPNSKYIFVSNQAAGSLSIIEAATNTVIADIKGEWDPSGLAPTLDNEGVYAADISSSKVVLFRTDRTKFVIPVEDNPIYLTMHPNGLYLYVANASSKSISVISTATNTIVNTFRLPYYIADIVMSPNGTRLYATDHNTNNFHVINAENGTIITSIRSGLGTARIALNSDGSRAYVTNSNSDDVTVINTLNNTIITTIKVDRLPNGIALSPDGNTLYVTQLLSNNVSVIDTKTNTVVKKIAVGKYPLSVTFNSSSACGNIPLTYNITVNPAPPASISANSNMVPLATVYGTASATSTFEVSGTNLTSGIIITPPAGFEVSTDNRTFSGSLTVGSKGNVPTTQVYIRLAATTHAGTYSGDVSVTSAGTTSINLNVPESRVSPAPLTVKANDVSRPYGTENPAVSASYSGFVNNDGPASLSSPPMLFTNATIASDPGVYDITVTGATSADYSITHINGKLTVKPLLQALVIPNTFTPNGDGINDTWIIKNLDTYANSSVEIYNRNGQRVYVYNGHNLAWNGQYNGNNLPAGTYYYTLTLAEKAETLKGFITLIR